MLQKVISLALEVENATRWASWGNMMSKYSVIRTEFITASEEEDATIQLNSTIGFKRKAEKVTGCFQDINCFTYSLQTQMYNLCSSQQDLDALLAECQSGHTNQESDWYQKN